MTLPRLAVAGCDDVASLEVYVRQTHLARLSRTKAHGELENHHGVVRFADGVHDSIEVIAAYRLHDRFPLLAPFRWLLFLLQVCHFP